MEFVRLVSSSVRLLGITGLLAFAAWVTVVWATSQTPGVYHYRAEWLLELLTWSWVAATVSHKGFLIAGRWMPTLGAIALGLFALLLAGVLILGTQVIPGVWSPWSFPVGGMLLVVSIATDALGTIMG